MTKLYDAGEVMVDLDAIVAIYDGIEDVGYGYYNGSYVVLSGKKEVFVSEDEVEDLRDAWWDRHNKKKTKPKKKLVKKR